MASTSTGPACLLSALKSQYQFVHDHEHPVPEPHEILIQIEAVGLNPIDWKSNAYGFAIYSFPWINGRECAGRIISIGKEVDKDRLKVGDRVFVASSNYRDIRTSSFQERCVALPENCGRIPKFMSYEEAAGLGVALIAGAAALYDSLSIRRQPSSVKIDRNDEEWILIWATASSAGILTTQLAKASGLRVLGVSSKANFEYTKSLGVDIALDREDPEEVVRVAKSYNIKYAVDCVGPETSAFAVSALAPGGTLVALVKGPKEVPEDIKVKSILIKRFHEDRAWGEDLMQFSEALLADRRLRPPRIRLVENGFAGIHKGLELLQNNEISGEKVVVRARDTPRESHKRTISRSSTPIAEAATPVHNREVTKRQKIAT